MKLWLLLTVPAMLLGQTSSYNGLGNSSPYTDTGSIIWAADNGCTTSTQFTVNNTITGTNDPTLYQHGRLSTSAFSCTYSVTNSIFYTITLKFCNTQNFTTGQRIFNIFINNALVRANFDLAATAPANTAFDLGFTIPVSTGQVIVNLQPTVGGVLLNAIGITAIAPGTLTSNNTFSGNNTFTGSTAISSLNGVIKVDGTLYPLTNVGIQAAVNAAPDGGEVDLGPGTYILTGTGAEEILITKRLNFVCSGWGTILQVGASVPATTDIIHLKPSALVQGARIQDCYITPASGTPGRHGISIDGTTSPISNLVIEHVRIDAIGGKSIAVINATGQPTGTPFTTTISNSYMAGAVDFTNGGDSLNILGNTMTGSGGLTVFLTGATVQPASNGGAHGFVFRGNNFTNTGGILINNAWQGEIVDNDIEVANLAEVNAACIDLDGNSNANVENFKISGNFLACANGVSSVDQIRVSRMNAAVIEKNFIARSVGVDYRVLAAADRTQIFFDRHAPSGEQVTLWLANAGTNTVVKWIDEVTGVEASTSTMAWGPANSTTRNFAISGVQLRAGNNSAVGFSSGDPTATGLDTGLSRVSAANMAIGNGTVGDTSGTIKSSGFLANCNTSQRTETAADTNLLTCGIPAAVGSYRIRFVLSLSAANAATLGWTATWTDSNGAAQTPTNLALFQSGTAAPALTFTTSAVGNFYGYADIDVNNAGTSPVVKLTFSGTSFTGKASATVERII